MTYADAKQRLEDWSCGEIVEITPEVLVCCYNALNEAMDVNILLGEIVERIEKEVWDTLSDGGDDWFASAKVYDAMEIIKEYIK